MSFLRLSMTIHKYKPAYTMCQCCHDKMWKNARMETCIIIICTNVVYVAKQRKAYKKKKNIPTVISKFLSLCNVGLGLKLGPGASLDGVDNVCAGNPALCSLFSTDIDRSTIQCFFTNYQQLMLNHFLIEKHRFLIVQKK